MKRKHTLAESFPTALHRGTLRHEIAGSKLCGERSGQARAWSPQIKMTTKLHLREAALLIGVFAVVSLLPAPIAAQSTGRVEFAARVTPTGGRPEPVRQLTFYLLRKSLEDIRTEALESAPPPDLDKFVDGLEVSPELKAWMKKHRSVQLSGDAFIKGLTPDEIVDVPEFFKSYLSRNIGYKGTGYPDPKFLEKDRKASPEKYEQDKAEFIAAIRRFIATMPESVQGIDIDLNDINPFAKWTSLVQKQRRLQESRALELAQERYLVAQTDTDLEGHGSFAGIAPGSYWIGMLNEEAISGDVRLRWDFLLTVRSGETTQVQLSNLNAVKPGVAAQNLNP